jgi:excisionase family DNA binding protein
MSTKRAAIYVRVSTPEQSTKTQQLELTEYARMRGWTIQKIYRDDGFAGARLDRPGLQQLLADCKRRKLEIDVVLVWKFDSRDHFAVCCLHWKHSGHWGLISVQQRSPLTQRCHMEIREVIQMEKQDMPQSLWKIHEVARFLGLTVGTCYHLVSEGRIPVIRLSPRCIRFDPEQLAELVRLRTTKEREGNDSHRGDPRVRKERQFGC